MRNETVFAVHILQNEVTDVVRHHEIYHLVLLRDDSQRIVGLVDQIVITIVVYHTKHVLKTINSHHLVGHFVIPLNVLLV